MPHLLRSWFVRPRSILRSSWLVVSCALALLAGGCEAPVEASPSPIVDGTRELGEEAVVLVTVLGALGLCTGTLIAPDVVLTAKHCVQGPGRDSPYPISALGVGVGNAFGTTRNYRVRYVDTTPGVYTQSPTTGLSGAIFGVDVGVLILRDPVEGVTPIAIRRDAPDDLVGQTLTAIGFGNRPDGGTGEKYTGDGVLDAIRDGILYTSMTICSGDSGGPLIQELPERMIVGVASFGEAGACPSRQDGYNAVFNQLDLIDRAMILAGHCVDLGEERCNSLDDDCDGDVDEGCAALGQACAAASECAFAQLPSFLDPLPAAVSCEDLGAGPVCALPCDALAPASSCASIPRLDGSATPLDGFYCQRRSGCDAWCVPGAAGAGRDGAACATDTDCASLLCLDPGDGDRRCLAACQSGAGTCPVNEVCVNRDGECGGCVDGALVSGGRRLGEPCGADSECEAGRCVDAACATACETDAACPSGYRCEEALCRRGGRAAAGHPCESDEACAPGFGCYEADGRRLCASECGPVAACGTGYACVSTGEGDACVPDGALLGEACGADAECVSGLCREHCTLACSAEVTCPIGFACTRDDDGNARCQAPTSGGGCAVAPTRGAACGSTAESFVAPCVVGLVFVLAFRRRPRRRS